MEEKRNKKTHRFEMRLSDIEYEMFVNKAKHYKRMSTMVCDAVAQYNDIATIGKIDSLNNLSSLLSDYRQEISRQGNNLNQVVKRANELFLMGELNEEYIKEEIKPMLVTIEATWSKLLKQQNLIRKSLIKL